MDSGLALRAPRNDGAKQHQGRRPMNDMVLQKLESGLLTITMNRPERKNALNPEMVRGLVEAARRAAEDPEVRAVLFKGAGGSFCVGGAVKSMGGGRAARALRVASKSCKSTTAFAKVGFSGDYGGTYFLTQLIGSARARELYLTSP